MKDIEKKTWLITIIIAVLITICCMFVFNINTAKSSSKVFECLCNSFFVSGFVILCFGLLTWCGNQGAFIGLGYGFRQIFEKRRFEKNFAERESYGDYRSRKLKKQQNFLHLIIVGSTFVLISIIFLLFV